MKVAKDTFLIQVESAKKSTGVVGLKGANLVVDTEYNKFKHSTMVGKIFAQSIQVTSQYLYDTPLNVGDEVIFHHFVCRPDHKIEAFENVYRSEYFHIYAKIIDDRMEPLEDAIFVEPIKEKEEDLFCGVIKMKTQAGLVQQQGIVFASSRKARSWGVLPGDKVHFTRNAEYEMKALNKDLYRMRIRNILCIERGDELICLQDKILVKALDYKADYSPFAGESQQLQGEVVCVGKQADCVAVGDIINFFSSIAGGVNIKGNKYYFLEPRHINFIV
jgi:co-chaperonin GroES (HSP10)